MIPFMTGPLFRNLNSVHSNAQPNRQYLKIQEKKKRERKIRKENDIKIKHLR